MIILSQDKETIVNFDNLIQIYITKDEEKTEDGEYIVDSNACQTLVRHLIRIVDNEEYDVTCLHCGSDTPLYCEKCYQELITKNAELQMVIKMQEYRINEMDIPKQK